MKLVIRADDVGYTDVCNIGTFKTFESGICTSADVMLDTPGTIDALKRLRAFPWISIGWHTHFWGRPVLGKESVQSMYDEKREGFRKDLLTAPDVVFEEAVAECRAQIQLCASVLGRTPDVGMNHPFDSPFCRALKFVQKEYSIVTDFMDVDLKIQKYQADEVWKHRKICMRGLMDSIKVLKEEPLNEIGWTDSIQNLEKYDPIKFYVNDESGLLDIRDESITVHAWHPGYVDYYMYKQGDYSPPSKCFLEIRTVDSHALCSNEVKQWIQTNKIELVNMRDALYGTSEYQNHLRATNSELALEIKV